MAYGTNLLVLALVYCHQTHDHKNSPGCPERRWLFMEDQEAPQVRQWNLGRSGTAGGQRQHRGNQPLALWIGQRDLLETLARPKLGPVLRLSRMDSMGRLKRRW